MLKLKRGKRENKVFSVTRLILSNSRSEQFWKQNKMSNSIFILKGVERLTLGYLMSACETVRRRSSETAVTFLYVPIPPPNEADYEKYLPIYIFYFSFLFSF